MTVIRRELEKASLMIGALRQWKRGGKKYASQKSPIISNEPMGLPAAISQLTAFFVFDKRLNVANLEEERQEWQLSSQPGSHSRVRDWLRASHSSPWLNPYTGPWPDPLPAMAIICINSNMLGPYSIALTDCGSLVSCIKQKWQWREWPAPYGTELIEKWQPKLWLLLCIQYSLPWQKGQTFVPLLCFSSTAFSNLYKYNKVQASRYLEKCSLVKKTIQKQC